jgi:hypothetical protein
MMFFEKMKSDLSFMKNRGYIAQIHRNNYKQYEQFQTFIMKQLTGTNLRSDYWKGKLKNFFYSTLLKFSTCSIHGSAHIKVLIFFTRYSVAYHNELYQQHFLFFSLNCPDFLALAKQKPHC